MLLLLQTTGLVPTQDDRDECEPPETLKSPKITKMLPESHSVDRRTVVFDTLLGLNNGEGTQHLNICWDVCGCILALLQWPWWRAHLWIIELRACSVTAASPTAVKEVIYTKPLVLPRRCPCFVFICKWPLTHSGGENHNAQHVHALAGPRRCFHDDIGWRREVQGEVLHVGAVVILDAVDVDPPRGGLIQ